MAIQVAHRLHLDTNIFVHAVRGGEIWEHIKARHDLLMIEPRPAFSFAVQGEALSLAGQWQWGAEKVDKLSYFFRYFERRDVTLPLIEAYAEIDVFSRNVSVPVRMGKNDLWIAATAYLSGATLLTTDRDFDHLHGTFFDRILMA